MDETVLFPSPNWFQVSGLAISQDRWLVYGGPSKSLCILEPLPHDYHGIIEGLSQYKAHVFYRVHKDKITSVALSPEWPEKKCILTGSADGSVKQWVIEKENNILDVRKTHSHDVHVNDMEELAGAGYSNEVYAITVGCFGNLVKWDLNSNVVRTYNSFFKNFKPTCMSCSQHIPLNIAVGTKQGVIFVLDLTGNGKILYKVRGQDEEIVNVSWCPQYDVAVKKALDEVKEKFSAASRLDKIRNEPEPAEETLTFNTSGVQKELPEDSFNETVVEEDDTFDIYKDHEADEFGHKKFQPQDIFVKVKKDEQKQEDYLAECLKLKEEILKRKNESEQTIETLVEALDKTQIEDTACCSKESKSEIVINTKSDVKCENDSKSVLEASDHIHKHLLATIGKYGGIRIWSKTGKLVASCTTQTSGKNFKTKSPCWPNILWYKPDTLLITDTKNQLLECNPLIIDCKNKLKWHIVHGLHKRGLFGIATDAPRVQSPDTIIDDNCSVWTVAQDRTLVRYNLKTRQKVAVNSTCGGFVYTVRPCPYDAGKVAVSVGDGSIRVWQTNILDEDNNKLASGHVSTYWQNVQGKVLTVAWHPTKEYRLAFSTAEARVGLIDTSGKIEKPARLFQPVLSGGIYSLCWGEENDLYACGRGNLVIYDASKTDEIPKPVSVTWEGQKWEISAAVWYSRGFLVGSNSGAVALLTPHKPHIVNAVAFVFGKMIHTIDWHPQETTNSSEESQYKNLIAVCSMDKANSIAILEYITNEDGSQKLSTWKSLIGHKGSVLQIQWNPHRDAQILSTSADETIRVWDAVEGVCTSIFAGHSLTSLGAAWSTFPQFADKVMSGGGDCCLRLWDIKDHPADTYDDTKREITLIKEKKKKGKKVPNKKEEKEDEEISVIEENTATSMENKIKSSKKFILLITQKQIQQCDTKAVRKMLQKHTGEYVNEDVEDSDMSKEKEHSLDFIKMFGNINEVNELLDMELQKLLRSSNLEGWSMLMIFRGHIDPMIQLANQRDFLCPYLVSITPCVSFKYWKDATQLYIAQIDRMVAKGLEDKLAENRSYGGPVYRKVGTLLSLHDIKGAVNALVEANLYKEAYILCRIRYMESIAQDVLQKWAHASLHSGSTILSAICHIALGKLAQAAEILAQKDDQACLSLAADLAKIVGQNTYADHIERKVQNKIEEAEKNKTEELLQELPSRMELLLNEVRTDSEQVVINGDSEK